MYYFYCIMSYIFNLTISLATSANLLLIDQMEGSGGQSAEREEPEKEAVLNHILVEQLLETVGERERRLLQLRYYEGKTQCEVAELLSMSQVQVSRLEKKLLLQLRERVRM